MGEFLDLDAALEILTRNRTVVDDFAGGEIDALANQRPCLLILDLVMPVMTGREVLAEMKARIARAKLDVLVIVGENRSFDHIFATYVPKAGQKVRNLLSERIVNADGSLGARNGARCASIEHKLGIHASPTAVMVFDNAVGYLVGEENKGLAYMFIMMNAARFAVGMQGISVAERAYQKAVSYARDRVQSRDLAGSAGPVAIIHHPDVKRMLMSMRAQTEAARALSYVTAAAFDAAHHHTDEATRKVNLAFYEFMVPIVKGWSTEMSIDVASTGVQVHGGMGFIEETGAAQHYRDARILTIYEGTTAIQANDLVGRKTLRDGGELAKHLIGQAAATATELIATGHAELAAIGQRLAAASNDLKSIVEFVATNGKGDIKAAFAGSVPYLKIAGIVFGGWQMARAAKVATSKLAEGAGDASFYKAKIATARFFADHYLSTSSAARIAIVEGSVGVLALADEQF